MSLKVELATAACTVACAFAIGFVMQSGDVAELRYGTTAFTDAPRVTVSYASYPHFVVRDMTVASDNDTLDVQQITLASAELTETERAAAATRKVDQRDVVSDENLALAPQCDLSARAVLDGEAMMTLKLEAPCYGQEQVLVSYAEQSFSETLSSEGKLETVMPAADDGAHVRVSFANGERITALAGVVSDH